jgi:hypothetical protein
MVFVSPSEKRWPTEVSVPEKPAKNPYFLLEQAKKGIAPKPAFPPVVSTERNLAV